MTEASDKQRPGARFRFDRLSSEPASARYAVVIGEGEQAFRAEATLGAHGAEVGPFDHPPPAWTIEVARGLLRTLAKNHTQDGDWPRRVHRWRASRP